MASEEQAQGAEKPVEAPVVEEKEEYSRVVMLTGTGGLNKVNVQKVQKPKPKEGEVLIKVHARYGRRFITREKKQLSFSFGLYFKQT